MFLIPDDLTIPEFLRRAPSEITTLPKTVRARKHKIDYPRDGYACKGLRQDARDRHRERLRRRAERMRKRK
jgi:hypothetical protein